MINCVASNNVLKSINDPRKYKHIQLDNGLQIMFIRDKESTMSTASLSVGVGSIDEIKIFGLAHFLEHLLFLGNEKYTGDNIYGETLAKYNGMSNAFTSNTNTTYYFEVQSESYFEILDIFANFFISPLFTESAVSREMNAVNSEHNNNILNDSWRFQQLLKTITKKNHKFNHFGTGCLETLNIPDIVNHVKDFYKKYYSSDNMALTIVSNISIKKLEKFVCNIFSQITKKSIGKDLVVSSRNYDMPYNTTLFVKYVPIKTKTHITMIFQIDIANELYDKYKSYSIPNIISHILGHEGHGSIFNLLRQENLALNMAAGFNDRIGNICVFNITIETTPEGFTKKNKIMYIVYNYIEQFKQTCLNNIGKIKEQYNENRILKQQELKFLEKSDQMSYAIYLSSKMLECNYNRDIIVSDYILNEYDDNVPYLLSKVLSFMIKSNCVILYSSKEYDKMLGSFEKWYGVEYLVYVNKIKHTPVLYNTLLHLPNKNPYICKKMKVIRNRISDIYPKRINGSKIQTWHQFNNNYNVPYIYYDSDIMMESHKYNIKEYLAYSLFVACIVDIINPDMYECNMSNYNAQIYRNMNGIKFSVYGPSEKIHKVVEMILKQILYPTLSEDVFIKQKTKLSMILQNSMLDSPHEISHNILCEKVDDSIYSVVNKLKEIQYVTFYDIKQIFKKIKTYSNIRNFIAGNIIDQDALSLSALYNNFKQPDNINKLHHLNILENGKHVTIKEKSYNSQEKNSSASIYVQLGYVRPGIDLNWNVKKCVHSIVNSFLSEKFFDELRTKEQLGYTVYTAGEYFVDISYGFICQKFVVQSIKEKSDYLAERIKKFIRNKMESFEHINETEIDNIKKSLIEVLKQPKQNLYDYCNYRYHCIVHCNGIHNFNEIMIETYEKITLDDVKNFYRTYFIDDKISSSWTIQIN